MKSLFYAFLFISMVTACSDDDSGGGAAGPKITNSKPGTGSIYVMGDSLAFGEGSVDKVFTPTECLQNEFTGSVVSNYGISGLQTNQLVANVPFYLGQPPKVAFISTGGNDAVENYYNPGSYPADKSARELKKIILQFQNVGSVVVYLALNPPYDAGAAKHLQGMAKVARENGAIIVNGMDGLWTDPSKMTDEFHPNDKGYEIMCDRIIQAVSPHYP
jgi:lysophospholipase L1-like esterase